MTVNSSNNTPSDVDSDIITLSTTTSNMNLQSSIHRPQLYKKTSSSQLSLRRYSILQSDNEMSDDLIRPSLSHQDSDVEIFSDSKLITDAELAKKEEAEEKQKINFDDDFIEFSSSSTDNNTILSPDTTKLNKDFFNVLDVRFVDYYLDNSSDEPVFAKEILTIVKLLKIKKWYKQELKPELLVIRKISGAMTNAIYQLTYKETVSLPSLLLRVYGPNVDSIIDREYELQVLARLSNLKIGPKLFGCFNNGRFEEFLEGSVTLTKDDVRDDLLSYKVSKRMRELHFFVPLTKNEKREGSITWKRVDNWLQTISNIDSKILNYVTQFEDFRTFIKLIEIYRIYLDQKLVNKQLSFTHCDTQYGNLLKVEDEIVVIDFEYSGPNPPAFDIANHFSEWMHDYHSSKPELLKPSKYPSKEEIDTFLKGYNFEDTSSLYDDIIRSRALMNLHWVLWGILQSGVLGDEKKEKV
ncbi:hypothetical protein ACO0SA_004205 [Hanseniaspora valbyensis]